MLHSHIQQLDAYPIENHIWRGLESNWKKIRCLCPHSFLCTLPFCHFFVTLGPGKTLSPFSKAHLTWLKNIGPESLQPNNVNNNQPLIYAVLPLNQLLSTNCTMTELQTFKLQQFHIIHTYWLLCFFLFSPLSPFILSLLEQAISGCWAVLVSG